MCIFTLKFNQVLELYLLRSTIRRAWIVGTGIIGTHWTSWTGTTPYWTQRSLTKKQNKQKQPVRQHCIAFWLLTKIPKFFFECTSIFSSISCFAWSICCGDPRIVNSLKFGSPFGGGWWVIFTKAPVCWLMDLTFSPPLPITSPHLWAGTEKAISPPQLPWPRPCPWPPGGIPGPPPGGPCGDISN